jgi:hypothetical protein
LIPAIVTDINKSTGVSDPMVTGNDVPDNQQHGC